jgi:hypothetical protein
VVPVASPLQTDEDRAKELLETERAVRRDMRWVYGRAIVSVFLSLAFGLWMIGWSVHSTDQKVAPMFFWAGLLVGNGGILVTMVITWIRALEEGWL